MPFSPWKATDPGSRALSHEDVCVGPGRRSLRILGNGSPVAGVWYVPQNLCVLMVPPTLGGS